jgi:hypothetical protein
MYTILIGKTISSDWTEMVFKKALEFDLVSNQLQIKTEYEDGKEIDLVVRFKAKTKTDFKTGAGIRISFREKFEYEVRSCGSLKPFDPQPSKSGPKVWTIFRKKTDEVKLKVTCNGILLLDQNINSNECSDVANLHRWTQRNEVKRIIFESNREKENNFSYRALPIG